VLGVRGFPPLPSGWATTFEILLLLHGPAGVGRAKGLAVLPLLGGQD